jgi:3-isopropylmalate/(R)-2-methylmalate dehydratase large subunit
MIGFDGATYRAMQWEGPRVHSMSMDDRMTIANMAIEAGGKNVIFPCDDKTIDYVRQRVAENGTKSDFDPVELDAAQSFIYERVPISPSLSLPVPAILIQATGNAQKNWNISP